MKGLIRQLGLNIIATDGQTDGAFGQPDPREPKAACVSQPVVTRPHAVVCGAGTHMVFGAFGRADALHR